MTAQAKLKLAPRLSLPVAAVTRTVAVVGQKGTGKTSTAVVMVEEAAAAGARFAWIDPTGAASGLRANATGDGPGLDCVVMGGFNGDVPLSSDAGEVVARLVVEEGYSVVCDLERMPKTEQVAFVADFSEAAYHLCRSAVTVVYDEAPRFVPQTGGDGSDEAKAALRAVTDVVMLGRRKGLGSILISQRPAKLHKDVFEQSDVLIAHRLMGNNDRKAIAGWLENSGDDGKDWLEKLPNLPRGEAVAIAPEYGIGGIFKIRRKRTFDSSAEPEIGAVVLDAPRARSEIDLSALEEKMGAALEAAQAEDPAALKRRIEKLEEELAAARDGSAGMVESDLAEMADARLADANERIRELEADLASAGYERDARGHELERLREHARAVVDEGPAFIEHAQRLHLLARHVGPEQEHPAPTPEEFDRARDGTGPAIHVSYDGEETHFERVPQGEGSAPPEGDGPPLKAGAWRMAEMLLRAPRPLERNELSSLANVRGGTLSDYLSALRAHGFIDDTGAGLTLTVVGQECTLAHLGKLSNSFEPLKPGDVLAIHRGNKGFKAGAARIMDVLMRAYPEGFTRTELSGASNVRGGTFSDYLSFLRKRLLIDERNRRIYAGELLYLWEGK